LPGLDFITNKFLPAGGRREVAPLIPTIAAEISTPSLGIGAGITGQKRTFYEGRLPPQHVLQTSSRITDLAEEEPM